MFSGKTEELQRRLRRAEIAGYEVRVFKPSIDKRYHESKVVSHNQNKIKAQSLAHSSDLLEQIGDAVTIGIDEAQFFDHSIVDVCNQLADKGCRVIISGLEKDFKGESFGPMPQLMAVAEKVDKLYAICTRCGEAAHYSFRKTSNKNLVAIGADDIYEARCRLCFNHEMKK